jgi:hypothetical protein
MAKVAAQAGVLERQHREADGGEAAYLAGPISSRAVIFLADLVPDANREVVLFNDSALRSIVLRTDAKVLERGQNGARVTLAGDDVTDFTFLRFDNGICLHVPAELDLVVERENA